MTSPQQGELLRIAQRYIWWEEPAQAVERTDYLLCQLMQLGTWEDVSWARGHFGDDVFRSALLSAQPGVLDARSWTYWHKVLGVSPIPPLPVRVVQ